MQQRRGQGRAVWGGVVAAAALLLAGCGGAEEAAPGADNNPGGGFNSGPGENNASDCLTHAAFFETRVWPQLAGRCSGCHTEGGLAGGTRMTFVSSDVEGWQARNLAAVQAVVDAKEGGVPLLLLKPSGQHAGGHTGGTIWEAGTAPYALLAQLAGRLDGTLDTCGRGADGEAAEGVCGAGEEGGRVLRRLTHAEYAATLADLLRVEVELEGALTPGEVVEGFDNNLRLGVSTLLADQYRDIAERLGQSVPLGPLLPCAVEAGGEGCARRFIADFGLLAFRRPLTEADVERYLAVYGVAAEGEGFEAGVRWVITAMLQSPHLLYRTELGRREGASFRLTSWEIASELSYLFWGTMPDAALREAAASGALYEPAEIEAQARRLIQDRRSDAVLGRFASQWLGIERLPHVSRDAALYPDLTPAIREAMARETGRLLGELWREEGTLAELLVAEHTWLTPELAAYYGLPLGDGASEADGLRRVELAGTPFGGLLTQGSLMTTHALPTSSSPIHRGRFVREQLLCQPLPPPPSNLNTAPPPVDPSLTTRERYARHASDGACKGCHDLVDPIGFAFERFDGAGRWRADDGGLPIDDSGAILNSAATDGTFEGVAGLSAHLAASPDVAACYAEQWVRFGFGVSDTLPLDCYVARVLPAGAGSPSLSDPALGLTRTARFLRRLGGPGEQDVPGAEVLPLPGEEPGEGNNPGNNSGNNPGNNSGNNSNNNPGNNTGNNTAGPRVERVEQSRWETGYCADVHVTNTSAATLTWSVTLEVEGTLNNVWNAEHSAPQGSVTFTGAAWNATLEPEQTASFGFCASLP